MGFHEVRFPANLSFGSVGGPERRTEIVTLSNGFEERNTPWAHSRRRYDAGVGLRSLKDIETLIAFFEARQGQLYGFRWKDWADYQTCAAPLRHSFEDKNIALGDGETRVFQLTKTYRSGGHDYVRPIRKPVAGSVRVGLLGREMTEGEQYSVDSTTGIVLFAEPPVPEERITAGFEFDVPARFDTDRIQTSVSSFRAGEAMSVPVVEVRI